MSGVALDHLVGRLEARVRDLRNGQLLVVRLLSTEISTAIVKHQTSSWNHFAIETMQNRHSEYCYEYVSYFRINNIIEEVLTYEGYRRIVLV